MKKKKPSVLWKDSWKLELADHKSLLELHMKLRGQLRARWKRALPFGDELFDRWEKAAFLGFKRGASIYDSSFVIGDVSVGEGTWIGPFTVLDGSGGLSIGAFCSISSGVQIYTHDTVKWALTGGKALAAYAPVEIGACCYIGSMTIIGKGVTIGPHSIIGANSFVHESVPAFSIVADTPAKIIGRVELLNENDVRLVYFNKRAKPK
jgi:acetyltransferase-like isoleucine patch superfamily enzyme